ncbi:MAG: hypothetical protein KDC52_03350 [Ignavibacteriae bacterium]|nr:hypothetical protein [Ignavibacteriota bacterium]
MNNIQTTYNLMKTLMVLRDDLANWARISREDKFSETHQKQMNNKALEIDELLREIGTEWITDYEENIALKKKFASNKNH